jgi:hypothetical protein
VVVPTDSRLQYRISVLDIRRMIKGELTRLGPFREVERSVLRWEVAPPLKLVS